MPQPLPVAIQSLQGGASNLWRANPTCMGGIGAVAAAWTDLERELVLLLSIALGKTRLRGDAGAFQGSMNRMAAIAIEQAETIRLRLKIINAALVEFIDGTTIAAAWDDLRKEILARSRERNSIVHATWRYATELPEALVQMRRGEQSLYWTEADFKSVLMRLHKLDMNIGEFRGKFVKAIHDGTIDPSKAADYRAA